MAPELFRINDGGKSGLFTREPDVFAFGTVIFEVSNVRRGALSYGFGAPSLTLLHVFTGQVPFAELKVSGMVTKRIIDDERPGRRPKGEKLGLSDEFGRLYDLRWLTRWRRGLRWRP